MTGTNTFRSFLIALLLLPVFAVAQVDSNFVKTLKPSQLNNFGRNAITQGDYGAAIVFYERYMKLKPTNSKGAFKLAECYRNYRDYKLAEQWYKYAYEKSDGQNNRALYYFAQMQKANGNYKDANTNFAKFNKAAGKDPSVKDLRKTIKYDIAGCDSAVLMIDHPKKIGVIHVDTSVNKVHVEHAPLAIDETTIIYSSLRTNKKEYEIVGDSSTNKPVRKFYMAKKQGDNWFFAGEYTGPFNAEGIHTGNGTFSSDGKRFYFTRTKKNAQEKMISMIYVSELKDGQWSEPEPLPLTVNNAKYTSTQPTVGVESKKGHDVIYFVSDRQGSKGGTDIFYTIFDPKKKTYRPAKNAGNKINTTKNEATPYYDLETHSLYFSSGGWAGMGGLDVFRSRGELTKFSPPENLGSPVNSGADELYYVEGKTKEEGFFVSNRKGGVGIKGPTCCDDLYSFKRLEYVKLDLDVNIYEGRDTLQRDKPIGQATVSMFVVDPREANPILIKTFTADDKGFFHTSVETGTEYRFMVSRDGFLNNQFDLSTKPYVTTQTIKKEAGLDKIPKGPIVLKNIYYEFDKAALSTGTTTTIDTTIYELLIENPNIIVEIGSHTDSKGTDAYNQKLSQRRAESVVDYLIKKGIAKERLQAKGYGETQPLAANTNADGSDNPAGRDKNRRTEFRIVGQLSDDSIDHIEYEE